MRVIHKVIVFSLLLFFSSCRKEQTVDSVKSSINDNAFLYSQRPGPNGEVANTLEQLQSELATLSKKDIRNKNYSVAIAMHDVHNDWSQALLMGMKNTLKEYGVSISLITDGEFNVDKQIADLENIIALKPELLISLPLDADKCSAVYRKAYEAGIKLVFIDAVPTGFTEKEYSGWAVGDGYRMGELSATTLADSLKQGDEVALLLWKNKMFTVDERSAGAKKVLSESTKLNLISEVYFSDFHEITGIVDSLIGAHPNVKGLWTVWDMPAFEAMKAIRKSSKDIKVATCDLSHDAATYLAKGEMIVGLGVDHPYNHGVTESLIAVAALEKIQISSYFVIPAQQVTRSNLSSSWKNIFHKTLPMDIKKHLN